MVGVFASSGEDGGNNFDDLSSAKRGEGHVLLYNGKIQYAFSNLTSEIGLHQWTHFCHVFSSGKYTAYVNGEVRAQGPLDTATIPIPLNSTIIIGQEQDSLAGGFDKSQVFRGHIAQVNLWNSTLSGDAVRQLATCDSNLAGNVFSSDREELELLNVTVAEWDLADLCSKVDEYVIFPEMRNLKESRLMCHRSGGEIYAPDTRQKNTALHSSSLQFSKACFSNFHLWLGLSDEENETVWRKFSDGSVVTELPFSHDQPNGERGENCMFMSLIDGLWTDTYCFRVWDACVPCEKDLSRPLRLRGLCVKEELETVTEATRPGNRETRSPQEAEGDSRTEPRTTAWTDEAGCTLIELPRSYRRRGPPRARAGRPVELDAAVEILRFVTISDVNRLVRLELNVEITWKDPRLRFLNLKDVLEWNKLSEKEAAMIWRPKLEFPNVFDGNVRLLREGVYVRKTGKQEDVDPNDVQMNTVYAGDSAAFVQTQHYSGSFACSFDVFFYPFDTQRCSVHLQLSSLRLEVVKIAGERAKVTYLEDKQLPSYTVTKYYAQDSFRGNNKTRYSVLKVCFGSGRVGAG
ncbi:putative neuronal pentraxin-1 isoform X2 [Penaeus vannamei]|uniref:Putative neuronal pentraxin-1 isoform X2 n=1 Tax=Penaeus vannamei TaxID=6689 RepID=A0A3R7PE92_PENVA|nr:putative neuronal pentraxin-1 isoform X2 [Penaeus vannamei]